MAIQKINLGTEPLGEGGDTYRSANTKINENFSNTEHAASRLVGTGDGQVATWKSGNIEGTKKDSRTNFLLKSGDSVPENSVASKTVGTASWNVPLNSDLSTTVYASDPTTPSGGEEFNFNNAEKGYLYIGSGVVGNSINHPIPEGKPAIYLKTESGANPVSWNQLAHTFTLARPRIFFRNKYSGGAFSWVEFYTTGNTTIGTNKQIITSSPVVRVFSDKIEAIHEAEDLPLEFIRNSEGDYTLKGTTGLRDGQNDWQIIIPKDDHDNQLIAFNLDEDADGTIHLKTFKRTFSMETFTFGPDLNSPLDIPEGRWIDLHFNDLPQEDLHELEPEVEPEVAEEEPVVESK